MHILSGLRYPVNVTSGQHFRGAKQEGIAEFRIMPRYLKSAYYPFCSQFPVDPGRIRAAHDKLVEDRPRENGAPSPAVRMSPLFRYWAFWKFSSESFLRFFPRLTRYTAAARAHRASLEQILEVARSRRMCCSRVWSVRTNARFPSLSTVAPASRPGIFRRNFLVLAKIPR